MTDIAGLSQRFGLAGEVEFKESSSGSVLIEVYNDHARATLALQGGHLMTWQPHGQPPVIWLSSQAKVAPGKSIRGGVPICWPWFGPHATEASYPAHGYVRTLPWELIQSESLSGGATRLVMRFVENEQTRALWPHATTVECHFTLGATLEIDLITTNNSQEVITLGQALHTYFAVSDVRNITIEGLEGTRYLDKVAGGLLKQQVGGVTIGAEVDRVYIDTTADCLINDPGLQRRIRIQKEGSGSTVVWNPWVEKANKMGDLGNDGYLQMVCVESANAADDLVTLAPGAHHHLWVRYGVEPI